MTPDPFRAYDDAAAATYDETRGGPERATAAAKAIAGLTPGSGRCLDVAGGTGIVSVELARSGYDVLVADRSRSMLRLAAERLPGRTMLTDASNLPIANGSVDVVVTLWLLHLLPEKVAHAATGEVARVLAPGGVWVTSVDKAASHGRDSRAQPDAEPRVAARAEELGLHPTGTADFTGRTQWGTTDDTDVATFRLAAFVSSAVPSSM